jgi:hypothetical protein
MKKRDRLRRLESRVVPRADEADERSRRLVESLPGSVRDALIAAIDAEGVADGPATIDIDALDLPAELKAHLKDAAEVGYWRGPPDPPRPRELPPQPREVPPQAPQKDVPQADECAPATGGTESTSSEPQDPPPPAGQPRKLVLSFPKPAPSRDVYGVPERYWKPIRL